MTGPAGQITVFHEIVYLSNTIPHCSGLQGALSMVEHFHRFQLKRQYSSYSQRELHSALFPNQCVTELVCLNPSFMHKEQAAFIDCHT